MPLPIGPNVGQPLAAMLPRVGRAIPTPQPAPVPTVSSTSKSAEPSFSDRLQEFVSSVDQNQRQAEHMATEYAAGRNDDIHSTMLTMQQADITLHLFANIRNRVIEAYKEISRMGA